MGFSHQSISLFCRAAAAVAGIGHGQPLDAVDQHPLSAGKPARRARGAAGSAGLRSNTAREPGEPFIAP